MGLGCFVVGFELMLRVSLNRGYLSFVRRGGSNDFWCLGGVGVDFMTCELCGTTIPVRRNTLTL